MTGLVYMHTFARKLSVVPVQTISRVLWPRPAERTVGATTLSSVFFFRPPRSVRAAKKAAGWKCHAPKMHASQGGEARLEIWAGLQSAAPREVNAARLSRI